MAKIITAYLSDLMQQHLQGAISFSRMVELLNEKVNEPASNEPKNLTLKEAHDYPKAKGIDDVYSNPDELREPDILESAMTIQQIWKKDDGQPDWARRAFTVNELKDYADKEVKEALQTKSDSHE